MCKERCDTFPVSIMSLIFLLCSVVAGDECGRKGVTLFQSILDMMESTMFYGRMLLYSGDHSRSRAYLREGQMLAGKIGLAKWLVYQQWRWQHMCMCEYTHAHIYIYIHMSHT